MPDQTSQISIASEWSINYYKDIYHEVSCNEMFNILVPEDQRDWVKGLTFTKPMPRRRKKFCSYLNALSQYMKERVHQEDARIRILGLPTSAPPANALLEQEGEHEPTLAQQYTVFFQKAENEIVSEHPTGSRCHADIVALRRFDKGTDPIKDFCWGHVEATGKTSKSEEEGSRHAATYAAFHLKARPDLKMALGICMKDGKYQLLAINACVVYQTPFVEWNATQEHMSVLCGWMWRIYVADRDESLVIDYNLSSTPPKFTLEHNGKTISNLSVIHAGHTIGRRTIVLAGKDSAQRDVVVKEQYIKAGHGCKEDTLLRQIHAKGHFPGIVGLVPDSSSATNIFVSGQFENGETVTRDKTRLLLNKLGDPLLKVETPREVLMAIYDVLEVSRILFKEYKIFHRDYSKNNILLLKEDDQYTETPGQELKDLCFSRFLLDQGNEQLDLDDSTTARLATRLLLIDFDSGENVTEKIDLNKGTLPRIGTPVFMARRVRSRIELDKRPYLLPSMPDLDEQIVGRYEVIHPERLKEFSSTKDEELVWSKTEILNYHEHHLRYEAESLFWNLLFWCITAQPKNGSNYSDQIAEGFRVKVPGSDWYSLIGKTDKRNRFFILGLSESTLHPGYASLYSLLDDMGRHLVVDMDCSKDPLKKRPEYLHEVFQRLILNFLARNRGQSFMNLKRSDKWRVVEEGGYTGRSSTTRTSPKQSSSSSSEQSSIHSVGSKRTADRVFGHEDDQPKQPATKKLKLQ